MAQVTLTNDQITDICRQIRADGKADKRWDINLPEGKLAENFVTELFTGGVKCEVKRDFKVSETGNIAIEYRCKGEKSGIANTQAKWWLIILDGAKYQGKRAFLVETEQLKTIAKKYYDPDKITKGGDNNGVEMVLVPVAELFA
jgi:hypothetical protein